MKMRYRAKWEIKLQKNFRETKRRAVAAVPAGASAITEGLASLKLDFILSESKVWLYNAANDS